MQRDDDLISNIRDLTESRSVYTKLRELVLNQAIRPNEKLSIRVLATRFGTSTTRVREALIRLAVEGMIEHLPNGGFFTRPLALGDLQDAYGIAFMLLKQSIETKTSQSEIPRISNSFRQAIGNAERANAAILESVDANTESIEKTYVQIAGLSGNRWIVRTIKTFNITTGYVRKLDLTDEHRSREVARDMTELIDLLEKNRVEEAVVNLRSQFSKKLERLADLVKEANARALHARPLDRH